MYIGGVEHAILHLLYSRFLSKFLWKEGAYISKHGNGEPFKVLLTQVRFYDLASMKDFVLFSPFIYSFKFVLLLGNGAWSDVQGPSNTEILET